MLCTIHAATEDSSTVLAQKRLSNLFHFLQFKAGLTSGNDLELQKWKPFDNDWSTEFTDQYDRQNKLKGS